MGKVRFKGRDIAMITVLDRDVAPGSTQYVDPGMCLNQDMHLYNTIQRSL